MSVPLVSVSDLGNSAGYLLGLYEESGKSGGSDSGSSAVLSRAPIPAIGSRLLSYLSKSINLREDFTAVLSDDNDGHAYMNSMLRYCRSLLQKCRTLYVASTPLKQIGADKGTCATFKKWMTQHSSIRTLDLEISTSARPLAMTSD